MSFAEYYNLFYQKKECSQMEDASLIDCMKRNVSYSTQVAAMSWRTSDGKRPSTFQQWVQAFTETDEELQQLKHRQPRINSSIAAPTKSKTVSVPTNNRLGSKTTPLAPIAPVMPITPVFVGEPMDLSSAMAIVPRQIPSHPWGKRNLQQVEAVLLLQVATPGQDRKGMPQQGTCRPSPCRSG